MRTALGSLSGPRRRFVLAVAALAALAVVVAVVVAVVSREDPVDPVPQDEVGPVLLVPGYGGNTAGLEVMADALRGAGREVVVAPLDGSGRQDLADQAAHLADEVAEVLDATGATSVDLVGYSAGGVVVRLYVADLGGAGDVRRVVTLASPHHGTDLAALGGALGGEACPEACRQLAPDSDLLRGLNAGDETPDGPLWVAVWTEDDATVVPADSGELDGALSFSVQSVCPGREVSHRQVPRDPAVIGMVASVLGRASPQTPGAGVC